MIGSSRSAAHDSRVRARSARFRNKTRTRCHGRRAYVEQRGAALRRGVNPVPRVADDAPDRRQASDEVRLRPEWAPARSAPNQATVCAFDKAVELFVRRRARIERVRNCRWADPQGSNCPDELKNPQSFWGGVRRRARGPRPDACRGRAWTFREEDVRRSRVPDRWQHGGGSQWPGRPARPRRSGNLGRACRGLTRSACRDARTNDGRLAACRHRTPRGTRAALRLGRAWRLLRSLPPAETVVDGVSDTLGPTRLAKQPESLTGFCEARALVICRASRRDLFLKNRLELRGVVPVRGSRPCP
jgi:hypothetical protein